MEESNDAQPEALSKWGVGVVTLWLILVIGGAASKLSHGQTSGFASVVDLLIGGVLGLGLFATAILAYSFGWLLISLISHELPGGLIKLLKWIPLAACIFVAVWLFAITIYDGVMANRLVPASVHFKACMQPQKKVEEIYPQRLCADGWITPSNGKGRCSNHDGVSKEPIERVVTYQPYSTSQCKKRAHDTSWID